MNFSIQKMAPHISSNLVSWVILYLLTDSVGVQGQYEDIVLLLLLIFTGHVSYRQSNSYKMTALLGILVYASVQLILFVLVPTALFAVMLFPPWSMIYIPIFTIASMTVTVMTHAVSRYSMEGAIR